jgi:hypothetical protein
MSSITSKSTVRALIKSNWTVFYPQIFRALEIFWMESNVPKIYFHPLSGRLLHLRDKLQWPAIMTRYLSSVLPFLGPSLPGILLDSAK